MADNTVYPTSARMQQVAQRNGQPNAQQKAAQAAGNVPAKPTKPAPTKSGSCNCNH